MREYANFIHALSTKTASIRETLQTFGATFVYSVLDLRIKESKAKNYHVLSSAWAYV